MTINYEKIKDAIKAGYKVTVIINGEFYDLETRSDSTKEHQKAGD